jgi:hypothetical protein
VATGHLNVATGSFSRSCFTVKTSTKLSFYRIIPYIAATAKSLSPQKWRMWRQGTLGWTTLIYRINCHAGIVKEFKASFNSISLYKTKFISKNFIWYGYFDKNS